MFIGHYGPSFAIRALRPEIPLWLLFLAAQLVDIAWALLVAVGDVWLYLRRTRGVTNVGRYGPVVFAAVAAWIDRQRSTPRRVMARA